ncbi:MAG: hypothetical protein JW816_03170 [Candidatus Buchananbacteria bacterium]|nr:hypothetical protein [Candidatus Buchananbacteria bacterium]
MKLKIRKKMSIFFDVIIVFSLLLPGNFFSLLAAQAVEVEEPITINAYSIVCNDESDLPNWADDSALGKPAIITATTAADYVSSHSNCHLASGWDFQWGYDQVKLLPGSHIGPADGSAGPGTDTGDGLDYWKNFQSSTTDTQPAIEVIPASEFGPSGWIWVRENLQPNYVPFSKTVNNLNDYSAEIYCHDDILNYDNWDRFFAPEFGLTYYCVAFNTLDKKCGDGSVNTEGEQCDDGNLDNGDGCSSSCQLENDLSCGNLPATGWYGQYFNYSSSHPDMEKPSNIPDTDFGDPLSVVKPWNDDWYDQIYYRFSRVDDALTFNQNFFPFDMAPEEIISGHDFNFGSHWRAKITVPDSGEYEYDFVADDEGWFYLDGQLVSYNDLGTKNGKIVISAGVHYVDVFFAERHSTGSTMYFRFLNPNIKIEPAPAYCGTVGAYCGDTLTNQDWEQCDDGPNGSDTCTSQCQLVTPTQCSDLVLARVNVDEVKNWGNGDVSSNIFLGSSSNIIPVNTWFPLFWNGSAITDPDIASYEDVPGLAVQRDNGKVRLVLHGSGSGQDKEHADGNIEFYNANITTLADDSANPLEKGFDGTGTNTYNASNDEVWIADSTHSNFWLTGTTGDDGYYTNWGIVEDCIIPPPTDSIFGYKFNDQNQDKTKNNDEVGLPGWTIVAAKIGDLVNTLTIDSKDQNGVDYAGLVNSQTYLLKTSGTYRYSALSTSQADAEYSTDSDWLNSPVQNLNRPGTADVLDLYFNGNAIDWGTYTITHEYYYPFVSDGSPLNLTISDWYEMGNSYMSDNLGSLTVEIYQTQLLSTVTDVNGNYSFIDLDPGNYLIYEQNQNGWHNTTSWYQPVAVTESSSNEINFGNATDQSSNECRIFGTKFEDLNGNGVWDDGEAGLEGWTIMAQGTSGTVTTQTNEDGQYCFTGLGVGNLLVSEVAQEGWNQSLPETGSYPVALNNTNSVGPRNFGNYQYGSISGAKYEDVNGDGQLQEGDNPIFNWQFVLEHNGATTTTTTDELGIFNFTNLKPGSYTLSENLVDGWNQTYPQSTSTYQIDVTSGGTYLGYDFYNTQASICNPDSVEICDDGIDNNCDGLIDSQDTASCPVQGNPDNNPSIGGGGGGGGAPIALQINNEATTNTLTDSVVIVWYTNKPATSRVVYGTVSHNPVVDPAPNYGYDFSTPDDTNKVLYHEITITGLTPGVTYYFRPISAASPEIFGKEINSTTQTENPQVIQLENQNPSTENVVVNLSAPTVPGTVAGVSTGPVEQGTVAGVEYEEPTSTLTTTLAANVNQQDQESSETDCQRVIWVILILNLALAIFLWYRLSGSPIWWQKYASVTMVVLTAVPNIVWYPQCWLWLWSLILFAAFLALAFVKIDTTKNN